MTADAAEYLASRGVALVGIDSLNIDDTADAARPVHSTLLGAGVPIVEHLCNLAGLPEGDFKFFAVPAKVAGFGSWPVRLLDMSFRQTTVLGFPAVALRTAELEVVAVPSLGMRLGGAQPSSI